MKNIEREISRTMPGDIPKRLTVKGEPLLTAYGCVLVERDTGKSYVYTAANLTSGKSEIISRLKNTLTTSGVNAMVEKIRLSSVAGAGILEADRPFGEQIAYDSCRKLLTTFFKEILPEHGYAIRKEQHALAEHILNTLYRRFVSLSEAEVGTGKTIAYLAAAVLAKRGRLNGYWNMSFYTGTPFVDMAHMPILVTTSSIALQKAIVTDYIPELSRIMLEHEIIKTPLTAVIRKGREHYACARNLMAHIQFEHDPNIKQILESLLNPNAEIDLAEVDGLTAHTKRKIAVPERCHSNCPHRNTCPYMQFRQKVQNNEIDIQVCNHNYFIADTLRRRDGQTPLIPNYQSVIIDEAHKFLQAARSMYGVELSSLSIPDIKDSINALTLKNENAQKIVQKLTKTLSDESIRLFRGLSQNAHHSDDDEGNGSRSVQIDEDATRHIRNIRDFSDKLIKYLTEEPAVTRSKEHKPFIVRELEQVRDQAVALALHDGLICWLKTVDNESRFCTIPKDLNKQLYNDIWSKGIPTILTSGTLSAGGIGTTCADFSRIKTTLGLDSLGNRLTEISKPSPFDYRKNAILYISENVPFPDQNNQTYITAVTDEIEKLVLASHGHAAVLFTSYKAMGLVYTKLKKRGIPFPMFRLDKGGVREIEQFKKSGNGILFASGSMWEGIDIPGDALSMLIIIKLPFAVPDPISEYEQTLYNDMGEYKRSVIEPEMVVKTKQGVGRPIRTETDTAAIVFLDSRMRENGAYRNLVLNAIPKCRIAIEIEDIEDYFREVKSPEYYE